MRIMRIIVRSITTNKHMNDLRKILISICPALSQSMPLLQRRRIRYKLLSPVKKYALGY